YGPLHMESSTVLQHAQDRDPIALRHQADRLAYRAYGAVDHFLKHHLDVCANDLMGVGLGIGRKERSEYGLGVLYRGEVDVDAECADQRTLPIPVVHGRAMQVPTIGGAPVVPEGVVIGRLVLERT